ncbi:discoidin domain-containing protein [bacterium]|nr:discoidin domain-containing protein [bacterium]
MSRSQLLLFGLLCLAVAAPAQADLIGYWNFDEGAGTTVADSSGSGAGGTLSDSAAWGAGVFGGALQFGGNRRVTVDSVVGNIDTINQQVTVALWAYGDSNAAGQNNFRGDAAGVDRIISAHIPWDGTIYWDAGNPGYNRIQKAGDAVGEWTHWAFVKDASISSMQIYRNGALWHSGGGSNAMAGMQSFVIGAANAGGGESYNGRMDEFAVWNTVVSPTALANLAAGLPVNVVESGVMTAADGLLSPTNVQMSLRNVDGALAPGGVGVIGTTTITPQNGVASQSSTAWGGVASRAIDGNTNGSYGGNSVTHTNDENPNGPWWEVDLGGMTILDELTLYNRTDCCSGRLNDFTVSILDAGRTGVWSQHYGPNPGASLNIPLAGNPAGQFVRVELDDKAAERILSLAEVVPVKLPYIQEAGGILDLEVDPLTGTNDMLSTSGTLTLGGTLNVWSLGGAFARWQSFDLLDFGTLVGEFDEVNLPPLGDRIQYWDASALYTTGNITVAVPDPASLSLLALGGLALVRRRRKRA